MSDFKYKLTVFGDDYYELTKAQRLWGGVAMQAVLIVLIGLLSLLYAWVLDNLLGFIDLSYWNWFALMLVYYWFNLGSLYNTLRIKLGIESILTRMVNDQTVRVTNINSILRK